MLTPFYAVINIYAFIYGIFLLTVCMQYAPFFVAALAKPFWEGYKGTFEEELHMQRGFNSNAERIFRNILGTFFKLVNKNVIIHFLERKFLT